MYIMKYNFQEIGEINHSTRDIRWNMLHNPDILVTYYRGHLLNFDTANKCVQLKLFITICVSNSHSTAHFQK